MLVGLMLSNILSLGGRPCIASPGYGTVLAAQGGRSGWQAFQAAGKGRR